MAGFDTMSAKKRKEAQSKGGLARAKKLKEQTKTFDDVVKENISDQDLLDICKGLKQSAKSGNVKAVETILKCLTKKDDKPKTLEELIDAD